MGKYSFPKSERLHREKLIKELFERGSSFYLYPFKVVHLLSPDQSHPHQILISVSSRYFKKAVDRNTIKRRIREAYRLNKERMSDSQKRLIAYIYTDKKILPSHTIHQRMIETFDILLKNKT